MVLVVNGKVSMMEKTVSIKSQPFSIVCIYLFWTIKQRGYWFGAYIPFYVTSTNIV